MSLGVEHEDGVIDDRLDQLLVSALIEPSGFVAFRCRLSLKRVLAAHTASSPKSAPSIGPQTLMREPWLNLNTAERQVSDRMQELRKFRCAWHYASACRGAWMGWAVWCRLAVAGSPGSGVAE